MIMDPALAGCRPQRQRREETFGYNRIKEKDANPKKISRLPLYRHKPIVLKSMVVSSADIRVRGFPLVHADVSFKGPGYEAMFGWFQVISHDLGSGETDFSVDIAGQFQEFSNPFCYYGYKPKHYDAPSMNDPHVRVWKAYTFLCPLSLSSTKEYRKIIPLAGFTWGYTMSHGKPESLLELLTAGRDDWNLVKGNVSSQYPQWEFMDMPNMDVLGPVN
ncbi:MAG: hypothetical protein ACP5NK_07300 [Thermoplasmata archaeon]